VVFSRINETDRPKHGHIRLKVGQNREKSEGDFGILDFGFTIDPFDG